MIPPPKIHKSSIIDLKRSRVRPESIERAPLLDYATPTKINEQGAGG